MTQDEMKKLAEAMELPIDQDLVWELNIWNNGRTASANLVRTSDIDSKYDDILAGFVCNTLSMAMARAWASWQEQS